MSKIRERDPIMDPAPGLAVNGVFVLFGKMNVIVDVIDTEAVISGAARAVTEFKIGPVRVGTAANGAFASVRRVFAVTF